MRKRTGGMRMHAIMMPIRAAALLLWLLLSAGEGLVITSSAATPPTSTGISNRYIVFPKPGIFATKAMDDLCSSVQARTIYKFKRIQARVVEISDESALEALRRSPLVDRVVQDAMAYPASNKDGVFAPEKRAAALRALLSLNDDTQEDAEVTPYGVRLIGADKVPYKPLPRSDLLICVVDSGVYRVHEDLIQQDITGQTETETPWDTDLCGHGTHVTGTLVASRNGIGVVGAAPGTAVHEVKVFEANPNPNAPDACFGTAVSTVLQATEDCVAEANSTNARLIINLSLGWTVDIVGVGDFFQSLWDAGVLVVAAAGNLQLDLPGAYFYPAAYEPVVSVAAVDEQKMVAYFSQRNDRVDLAAPGVSVLSTCNPAANLCGGAKYQNFSGTSMATPHVSASAAIVWSFAPDWTNKQVYDALVSTAEDLGAPGRDNSYGFGLVNVCRAAKVANPDRMKDVQCQDGTELPPTLKPSSRPSEEKQDRGRRRKIWIAK